MKYLITGGCGFLGSNLASEAIRRGGELCVFDNLSRVGGNSNLEWLRSEGKFEFIQGDTRDPEQIERVVRDFKPKAIFHVAGQVAMTTSIANPRLDFEINALGTFNILEAARKHAPETAIVYSSSNKVYGDLEWVRYEETVTRYVAPDLPNGFDENTPLEFHSPYGCSKGAADQYMLDYARIFGLNTVVFRHSSIYGSRQFATYDQGWVGWFCQKALETKLSSSVEPFTISGNGKQVRDVLFFSDAVACYFAAVEHIARARGKVFNIGGGMKNSLSLRELFILLENILGIRLRYRELPVRPSDQKIFVADITKAELQLEWSPVVSAEEGLRRMLGWLENIVQEGRGNG